MTCPREIRELVERFEENVDEYKSGRYNETQLRREFIDPFFEALGWDVENKGGRSGLHREVIHEDSVRVREATKNPDYGFYVGTARKFFIEAKKPSVNLENDVKAAFQLRSYAWSAGLSISLLTDFEEFSIYDCRIEPSNSDSPRVGLLKRYTFDQYIDVWDEIAALFSREAVLGGSLERYIESKKKKRGTIAVDEAFLREIDSWREVLAKKIHKNNPDLTVRELNSSVQNTIDRIVFLRICEDRGIEKFGQLKDQLAGEMTIYARLVELFRKADEKYNSGIFHFGDDPGRSGEPDRLALSLKIDDEVLSEMIENLYPPRSPYRFSVIPAEILGHVYEQFLGKVISLGDDGEVEVEYKPEVRKAGGVYYTPTYIVDYIVENTVGKLLEGQTPNAVSSLRILDPACGSGSFLIGAYQKLMDWHLEWYVDKLVPLLEAGFSETSREVCALLPERYSAAANAGAGAGAGGAGDGRRRGRGRPRKNSSANSASRAGRFPIIQVQGGEWRLTTAERKRILLNNIRGVDIDLQATEVTKLSLQLKVLEGENQETLSRQLTLFHERALPDLGENIKCGNSLIGPDFYDGQATLFDEEEMYRVNAFDWEAEFPEVMGRGGFDAVIGNPPYIFARDEGFTAHEKQYFKKYNHYIYQINTFNLFTEQGFNLLQSNGFLGYIIPNNWLSISTMKPFRDFIIGQTGDLKIVNNQFKVFSGANVDTSIILFKKTKPNYVYLAESYNPNEIVPAAVINSDDMLKDDLIQFRLYKNPIAREMLDKIEIKSVKLEKIAIVKAGLKAYETGKGTPIQTNLMKKNRVYHSKQRVDNSYRIYLNGKDVKRYSSAWSGEFLKYGPNLAAPRDSMLFEGERILVRQIPSLPPYSINAMIFRGEELNDINSMIIKPNDKISINYILGIINSRLLTFWFDYKFDKFQRAIFPQFKVNELSVFPIRTIDFSDPADVARHDSMVALVENMLDLHRRLAESKTGHEKTLLSRQIEATDRQIDALVYELYELTAEEIKIVKDL